MWPAAALAFGVVFLAEFGDKSQLLVVSLAGRFPRLPVLLGVSLAVLLMQALSVLAGSFIADRVPRRPVAVVAGLLFIAFAFWTLRASPEDEAVADPHVRRSAVTTAFAAFVAAEFGDKTMLATAALAANRDRLGVWLGSSAALVASAAIAVIVGGQLARRFNPRVLRYAAAGVMAVVGVLLLVGIG